MIFFRKEKREKGGDFQVGQRHFQIMSKRRVRRSDKRGGRLSQGLRGQGLRGADLVVCVRVASRDPDDQIWFKTCIEMCPQQQNSINITTK